MWVHVFSWSRCRWEWLWRPVGVVRAMKHLTLVGTIACTGITVWPPAPPVEAHAPPPPAQTVVAPPPPVGSFPPPWSPPVIYAPPVIPIPTGPVLPGPEGEQHTQIPAGSPGSSTWGAAPETVGEAPTQICDTPPESTSKVSEPGAISLFVAGLVLLGIWRALKYD